MFQQNAINHKSKISIATAGVGYESLPWYCENIKILLKTVSHVSSSLKDISRVWEQPCLYSSLLLSQRQRSSCTVILQSSPQLQTQTSICDEDRTEQHPPLCTFHTSPLLFDCKSKGTESLKHCECVKWERWTKSDLIYTWRKEAKCFVSIYPCVCNVCVLYMRLC